MPCESNSQGRDAFGSHGSKKGKESSKGARKNLCATMQRIHWGGDTSSARRRYAHQILTIKGLPNNSDLDEMCAPKYEITFSDRNTIDIHPHDNDPMVITV